MMRLPLVAVFGLAAAVTAKTCTDDKGCAADEFCRVAVAASGAACDKALPKTCVKRSVRGGSCEGGGGEDHECFINKCLDTLACRPNSQVLTPALPGACAKQCDIGGGEMVFEGWTGPVEGAGKWCHTRYCDGSDDKEPKGVLKTTGGDASAPCPTDLTNGLRCCVGAGDAATQACCGATGAWVTKDATGKVKCANVEAAHGGKLAAPFSKTCTDACPATTTPPPGTPAHDDGWKGPSTVDKKWCNTCVCTKGALACPDRECPKLACCPPGDKKADQVCCGVTGEWVTKDAKDNVVCGGVTVPYKADLATQPFHAACAATRDCVVSTTPAKTIAHGKTERNPKAGQGCNTCTCTDATAVCETAYCPPAQCCRDAKPTTGEQVCCGIDGLWKAVDTTAKCGVSVPTQAAGGGAATGYPFSAACVGCEADVYVKGAWKKQTVSVGWKGPKQGGVWCDTCTCKVNGAPTVCTAVADEKDCPAARCCSAAAPAPTAEYVCCGATGRWVKKGAGNTVSCGGVAFTEGDPDTAALLGAACTAGVCTLTGGEKVADGWAGRNKGADWCKLCTCDNKAVPKLSCTTNACTVRCCVGPKPTSPGTWKCCGATATWVKDDAAGDYSCGGVTLKTGDQLTDTVCPTVDPATTKCTLHDAAATKVGQGWTGSGLGTNWCHSACKCTAAAAGKPVSCPAGTCPAVEKLLCCAKEKVVPAHVCCGLTGEWVAADAKCGPVDLALAGTAAAPVSAACATCTAGTATVPVGWFGSVPGAQWCNKCRCVRDGTLKCTTKTCPPAKCCAAAKVGTVACCGTTGEWVAAVGGKYTCAHLTVEEADKGKAPFADACAGTCDHDGTPVALGWAGKKGDGCNYCKCVTAGNLQCSTRVCPGPPLCGTFNCAGAGKQMGVTTKPCVGACDAATCCAATCTEYVAHFPCTGPEVLDPAKAGTACPTCNAATCCAVPAGGGGPGPGMCAGHPCAAPNLVPNPAGVCIMVPCSDADCCLPTCVPFTCTAGVKKAVLPANCPATPCTNRDCCDPPP